MRQRVAPCGDALHQGGARLCVCVCMCVCARALACVRAVAFMHQRSGAVAHACIPAARSDAPDHPSRSGLRSPSGTKPTRRTSRRTIAAVPRNSTPAHACRTRNVCVRVRACLCVCVCVCVCVRGCARAGSPAQPPAVWKSGSGWAVVPLLQRNRCRRRGAAASLPRPSFGPNRMNSHSSHGQTRLVDAPQGRLVHAPWGPLPP
jgi:hypothetical protein